MNAQQIDMATWPSSARIVGWAMGAELQAKLAEGFLCGAWSPSRKAYAVMRRPKKRGRPTRMSAEQDCQALALYAEMDALRTRIGELAAQAGMTRGGLLRRLSQMRRA